ncbi:MAG TPA: hypothetical protein VN428_05085 [Bryobacteraceae bacterium]|nr:hypothetical protein [Bryobacteraceae bacterium]
MHHFLLALVVSLPVLAQSGGGLPPEWEVRKQLESLAENIQRFQPFLEKIDPQTWQDAPAGYTEQVKRIRAEIGYLVTTTQALQKRPDRLTTALESYFRMMSVDQMLRSLEAGVRRYQNPAIADILMGLITQETADRERLRHYLVELAADREQQFRVIDEEAQRCRGILARQPRGKTPDKKEAKR